MFARQISSQDETRPRTKSSPSMVKWILLFTRFCRDQTSFPDELIPVKKAGMKIPPGMKKRHKRLEDTSSRDEILKWTCFVFLFLTYQCTKNEVLVTFTEEILNGKLRFLCSVCVQICFSRLTCLNIMKVWI